MSKLLIDKIMPSILVKIVMLLLGYFAAVLFLVNISITFRFHMGRIITSWPNIRPGFTFLFFVFCFGILLCSVWVSKAPERPYPWSRVDGGLLLVVTFGVALLCVHYGWIGGFGLITQLLPLSMLAYMAVMGFCIEVTARIRDRQFINTLYWLQFFKIYPIWRPMGLMMALFLVGHLFNLLVVRSLEFFSMRILNVQSLVFSILTLVGLTYFCTFLLSMSAEYEKANVEKVRAERFKSELITNVSHDIRTPLTAIISYIDLMKALPIQNAEFTDYVEILERKTDRLKILIDDLMEASKAGTGNVAIAMQEIDLTEIIGQVAGEFSDQFARHELALVIRQPDRPVLVQTDRRHLWRTLENLFSNVEKYALPGTRVFAEMIIYDDRVVFSLKNTSQNPIDLLGDALTEQFIRGDHARHTEGNGLGLYISKSLVELMGGDFVIRTTGDLFEVEVCFY